MSCAILMSTYNGERYIDEQIISILNQTFKNWDLYIRDDGSTDNTIEIIRKYQFRYNNIHVIQDSVAHRGVIGSFLYLLANVDSDIFMFCDQDDVWLPDKIQICLDAIMKTPKDAPTLVTTDLIIVDNDLNVINQSMWAVTHITNIVNRPKYLQVATMYTGCTIMFNNAVKKLMMNEQIPDNVLHDQFACLTTYKHSGKIIPITTPTILYRQHGNNVVGIKSSHYIRDKFKSALKSIWQNYSYYKIVHEFLNTSFSTFIGLKINHLISYK